MTSVEFIVPIEPRGWARARKNGNRFFKDGKTASFEREIGRVATVVMRGKTMFAGPVILTVVSFLPIPASWSKKRRDAALNGEIAPTCKPDADNLMKGVADALNGIVYRDDAQVVSGHSTKHYAAVPCVQVVACEMSLQSRSIGPVSVARSASGSGREYQEGRSDGP